MTRREAIRRAEEWLSKETEGRSDINCNHPTYKFAIRCYMQCYNDMTEGKPDGWCSWHPAFGVDPLTFVDDEDDAMTAFYQQYKDIEEHWVIIPVKLLVMEGEPVNTGLTHSEEGKEK